MSRSEKRAMARIQKREESLKRAIVEALELCWEGRLPFAPLEDVLKSKALAPHIVDVRHARCKEE